MQLIATPFIDLYEHFELPIDDTLWHQQIYVHTNNGHTPVRPRAAFRNHAHAIKHFEDISPEANRIDHAFGIYVITFKLPRPGIYVGIAANDGKAPEGVFSRIKKHRVKVTGSHLGNNPNSVGGVNHTTGWRAYAGERYRYFQNLNESDTLEDFKLSHVVVRDEYGAIDNRRHFLENAESYLVRNSDGSLDSFCQSAFGSGVLASDVHIFNYRAGRYDGSRYDLNFSTSFV